MRKLAILAIAAAFVLAVPAAFAGDYHSGTSLICSDCHIMHYSQSHGYNSDGTGDYAPVGATGPYEYLLRNDVNDLCSGCHDGQTWAPDVVGDNTNSYVRSAGALNSDGAAPYYHQDGHTLGATDIAPGGTWSNAEGLSCVNCHNQHGSTTAYRNMRNKTGTATTTTDITYEIGTATNTKVVLEHTFVADPRTPMDVHFGVANVDYQEPDQTKSSYATFCKGCHTNFHGDKGGPEVGGTATGEWIRHPNSDANIGALGGGHSSLTQYNGRTNKVKVMSASGVWNPAPADVTPSCFSCHKSHGNKNAFGLIFMKGTGTVTEEGDDGTQAKNLCRQCHRQGAD
jgi:hypothetical protein